MEPREEYVDNDAIMWHHLTMKKSHHKVLEAIFTRPISGNIRWADIESLLIALGAEI